MLLALDTSTHLASLALCQNGEIQAEYTWDVGASHSVELLRRLEWLLKERGLTLSQVSAVAAATGPGSFTGVRVAVTVAKTLAFSLNVPLLGISTLDVIAYSQAAAAFPVCALMDAGRGELYAALYQQATLDAASTARPLQESSPGDGAWIARMLPISNSLRRDGLYWQRQGEYQVVTAEDLAQEIKHPTLFCGDLSAGARRKLAETLGPLALFVSPLTCVRRAGLLADLASQRLERGEVDDPLTLEPLYLRRPHITVSARQRPQLLGQSGDRGKTSAHPSAGGGRPAVGAEDAPGQSNGRDLALQSEDGLGDAKDREAMRGERWTKPTRGLKRQSGFTPGDEAPGPSGGLSWATPT
ncbi:MAG TPA: tRNA (adenosine(37)-N6)-threonylcarbamoyltransferase complex dimerization subunit type 1 TsaB [Ktedonobacterales bacterium]|jgi:tRNA threonylcarbamoyladenosine biosynthesis protein TsaB